MKDILEKRIQELTAQVQASGDKYNALQAELSTLATEHNVTVIKLDEAKELLANVVKTEAEANDANEITEAASISE